MMNKLTNGDISLFADFLSHVNQPIAGLGITCFEDINVAMRRLSRVTGAGDESWKRRGHMTAFDLLARRVGAEPNTAPLSSNQEVSICALSKVFDLFSIEQ